MLNQGFSQSSDKGGWEFQKHDDIKSLIAFLWPHQSNQDKDEPNLFNPLAKTRLNGMKVMTGDQYISQTNGKWNTCTV